MERLTEKITNKETGEVLAYRLKSNNDRIKASNKLGQYEDIATVEECRNAVEKMKPKRVITWANGSEHCPNCDYDNSAIGYAFCIDCGQALDWTY